MCDRERAKQKVVIRSVKLGRSSVSPFQQVGMREKKGKKVPDVFWWLRLFMLDELTTGHDPSNCTYLSTQDRHRFFFWFFFLSSPLSGTCATQITSPKVGTPLNEGSWDPAPRKFEERKKGVIGCRFCHLRGSRHPHLSPNFHSYNHIHTYIQTEPCTPDPGPHPTPIPHRLFCDSSLVHLLSIGRLLDQLSCRVSASLIYIIY